MALLLSHWRAGYHKCRVSESFYDCCQKGLSGSAIGTSGVAGGASKAQHCECSGRPGGRGEVSWAEDQATAAWAENQAHGHGTSSRIVHACIRESRKTCQPRSCMKMDITDQENGEKVL